MVKDAKVSEIALCLSVNCVSLAAVASSVEGPERTRLITDIHHEWGHPG